VGGGGFDGINIPGNTASGDVSTVGGGGGNSATGRYSTVAGGVNNQATGLGAFVGGGGFDGTTTSGNMASGAAATIGGGIANQALGPGAFVGGGGFDGTTTSGNMARGVAATIGGGLGNQAGRYSTVPGGFYNTAGGFGSLAAGVNAKALHDYSIVLSCRQTAAPSFAEERFQIHAYDGFAVDYDTQRDDGGGTKWLYVGKAFAGNDITSYNGANLTTGGVWANASDKNRKTDFAPVSSREILEKLSALPVRIWRYTNELASVRHVGPTAQDFQAAFGLGTDDKSIGTVDAEGVALAAIQGLNLKLEQALQEKESEIRQLKQQNDSLQEVLKDLRHAVRTLAEKQEH
jgi:hypothetical protein